MHDYQLYGLNITSTHPLPLLSPITAQNCNTDVSIDMSNQIIPDADWTTVDIGGEMGVTLNQSQDWFCINYLRSKTETLTFYVSKDGAQVISNKPDSIPISDVASFILGPIIGFSLRLKQTMCLHASVMEYGGTAFAFVGNKGAGKSTTAAALLNAGAKLISDDVAVLNTVDAPVQPGYPSVRLLPTTLLALGLEQENYERVVSGSNKRYVPLRDSKTQATNNTSHLKWQFQSTPKKLSAIYSLNARQPELKQTIITNLSNKDALMALAPHGYGRRILNSTQRAEEFAFMARLSKHIAVKSVSCPDELTLLPRVVDDILADVNSIESR